MIEAIVIVGGKDGGKKIHRDSGKISRRDKISSQTKINGADGGDGNTKHTLNNWYIFNPETLVIKKMDKYMILGNGMRDNYNYNHNGITSYIHHNLLVDKKCNSIYMMLAKPSNKNTKNIFVTETSHNIDCIGDWGECKQQ